MPLVRPLSWTVLTAAGFALACAGAAGRQPPKDDLPQRPRNANEVANFRQFRIPAGKMKEAKEAFTAYADYAAQLLTHPRVYSAPQEFRPDGAKGPPPPPTLEEILGDRGLIGVSILVPDPAGKLGPDDVDYVRELGVAYDAALKDLPKAGEQIVAVNGARALAAACRSGAVAHYKTVTDLINDPAVRPEAKYYLFQAAGHLLAAYDLNDAPAGFRGRKHSGDPAAVGALVAALQKAVEDPAVIFPFLAGADGKPAAVPAELVPAYHFIRREAIRALGQCRFAEFAAAKGQTLYPSFTLARVALVDPALAVPPDPNKYPAEVAEAVLGLCNMNPPRALGAEPYAYAMADAIAGGLAAFAGPKAAQPEDKSVPWRGYAGRLLDALRQWQGLYDANYTPQNPTGYAADTVPAVARAVAAEAERLVLGPLESGTGRINVTGLNQYRTATLRSDKKYSPAPYRENPGLTLPVGKN